MENNNLYTDSIQSSLDQFKQDNAGKTAFIIMSFSKIKPFIEISEKIKELLLKYNIKGMRADDKQYHPNLFLNILTYLHGCNYGIAVFERIEGDNHNPNIALEVGYMIALGKKISFLKEKTLKSLPTDLLSEIYFEFDLYDLDTIAKLNLNSWLNTKNNTELVITKANQEPLEISSLDTSNWNNEDFSRFFKRLRENSFVRARRENEGIGDDDVSERAVQLMKLQCLNLGISDKYNSWKKMLF